MTTSRSFSLIVPAFNEAENLASLIPEAAEALSELSDRWEILIVDDGSTDLTQEVLSRMHEEYPQLHCVVFHRNQGKSAALNAGFSSATGDIVVLCDGDGQNDPSSIKDLLAKFDEGTDLVTGRRLIRNDRFVKRVTSRLYNWTTSKITGVPGEDFNSGLKLMSRDVAEDLDVYGERHRYIPVLAYRSGFSVAEVDVIDRKRLHGETKFGVSRFWRGLLDLVTIEFLADYDSRPLHFFGGIGAILGSIGGALIVWMAILHFTGQGVGTRTALIGGVLMVITAVQLISLGLIAEFITHSGRPRKSQRVDKW